DGGTELILAQTRQNNDEVTGPQSGLGERTIEPISKQFGYVIATRKFDKNKTAIAHLSGYPWKNRVELGQVFEERLAAPENRHRRRPSELRGFVGHLPRNDRFIISSHIGEPYQPLGVILLTVRRLHQVTAEKIVESRIPAGFGMPREVALGWRQTLRGELG